MKLFKSDTCIMLSDEIQSFWYLICVFLYRNRDFRKIKFFKKMHFHNDCMKLRVGRQKFFFQIQHKILHMFAKTRHPNSKSLGKAGKMQKSKKNSNFDLFWSKTIC